MNFIDQMYLAKAVSWLAVIWRIIILVEVGHLSIPVQSNEFQSIEIK